MASSMRQWVNAIRYRIARNFRMAQIFAYFERMQIVRKLEHTMDDEQVGGRERQKTTQYTCLHQEWGINLPSFPPSIHSRV